MTDISDFLINLSAVSFFPKYPASGIVSFLLVIVLQLLTQI